MERWGWFGAILSALGAIAMTGGWFFIPDPEMARNHLSSGGVTLFCGLVIIASAISKKQSRPK